MKLIFDTDLQSFEKEVIEASRNCPILVDFWADWCPPCKALTPVLERMVHFYSGALLLAKVEVDEGENMKLAGHYKLRGFPTVILFSNGEEKGRFSGSKPEHWLREFLKDHLQVTHPT